MNRPAPWRFRVPGWLLAVASVWGPAAWNAGMPLQSGAARVSGVVVADGTGGTPIGGAIVTLSGPGLQHSMHTLTDDDGRFAFGSVPPGRVAVKAGRIPYLSMSYGATHPERDGVPIAVSPGQHVSDLRLMLPRGGVIAGLVSDEHGAGVPGAVVSAIRLHTPAAPAEAKTDGRGVYRLYGLPPGEYLVAAQIRLMGEGAITAPSAGEIDRLLAELQGRTRSGPLNPAFMPAARTGNEPGAVPLLAYPPVFWPGTVSLSDAGSITLAIGEERRGMNIVLRPAPAVSVLGTVRMADGGTVPSFTVVLYRRGPRLPPMWGTGWSATVLPQDPAGFMLSGVPPGDYQLFAHAPAARRGPPASDLWAMADVTIGSDDLSGVVLELRPGSRLRGTVSVAEAGNPDVPPDLSVVLIPDRLNVFTSSGVAARTTIEGIVKADGTFDIGDIRPGVYRLDVAAGTGFAGSLRSIRIQGREMLDVPFVLDALHEVSDAVITLAGRRADLTGSVWRADGGPAIEYSVVVFPADPDAWQHEPRRIRSTSPATDGSFTFHDLPPGEYLVAAVTDLRPGDLADAAFLSLAARVAVTATVREGRTATLVLKAVK